MLNREKKGSGEVGKIYDLLFVRVVKMCSVSSFHTKDIKLDSINNRALVQEWTLVESDVKSELFFFKNDEHDLYGRGRKYSSGWKTEKYEKWMGSNHWCKKEGKKGKKECYEEMDGDQ